MASATASSSASRLPSAPRASSSKDDDAWEPDGGAQQEDDNDDDDFDAGPEAGEAAAAEPAAEPATNAQKEAVVVKRIERFLATLKRTAWNIVGIGPLYAPASVKIATPVPWPADGLPPRIGFRPQPRAIPQPVGGAIKSVRMAQRLAEVNLLSLPREETRRQVLPGVMEQMKETQDMEWFPGKVADPRIEHQMVLEADRRANGEPEAHSRVNQEDVSGGNACFDLPFRHPALDHKRFEWLDQATAEAFTASKPAGYADLAAHRPEERAPSNVQEPDAQSQQLEGMSNLTAAERYVATFKEIGPRNNAKDGGLKMLGGVPGGIDTLQIPVFSTLDLPGSGTAQAKEKVHLLNAGGVVYDLAWRPVPSVLAYGAEYLAVSAAEHIDVRTRLRSKCKPGTPSVLQLWSVRPAPRVTAPVPADPADKGKARATDAMPHQAGSGDTSVALEMLIYHSYGQALKLAWCPSGHDYRSKPTSNPNGPPRRLGLLAGVFHDGTVRIFAVPHPDDLRARRPALQRGPGSESVLRIKLEAALTLRCSASSPTCLCWLGGEMLAAGTIDGTVLVWRTGDALRLGQTDVRPSHWIPFSSTSVVSVTWALIPYQSLNGHFDAHGPRLPHLLFVSDISSDYGIIDIHDPLAGWTAESHRGRAPLHASAWCPQLDMFICDQSDCTVKVVSARIGQLGAHKRIGVANGRVMSIATSPWHPFIAFGSADGSVRLVNAVRATTKERHGGLALPSIKVCRLDHNRSTGDLRLIDNLALEFHVIQSEDGVRRRRFQQGQSTEPIAWHPSIGARAVAWNPNMGRSHLLASGFGVGMVRIDRFEMGSVLMTGEMLAPEEQALRKPSESAAAAAAISSSSASATTLAGSAPGTSTNLAPSPPAASAQARARPMSVDEFDPRAHVVSFFALDNQIAAQAEADDEAEYKNHMRTIFSAGHNLQRSWLSRAKDADLGTAGGSAGRGASRTHRGWRKNTDANAQAAQGEDDELEGLLQEAGGAGKDEVGDEEKQARKKANAEKRRLAAEARKQKAASQPPPADGTPAKKRVGRPRKNPLPENTASQPAAAHNGDGAAPSASGDLLRAPSVGETATTRVLNALARVPDAADPGPLGVAGSSVAGAAAAISSTAPGPKPASAVAAPAEQPVKKRRGRPPKVRPEQAGAGAGAVPLPPPPSADAPQLQDGHASFAASSQGASTSGAATPAKKRGRPRKNALPDASATPPATAAVAASSTGVAPAPAKRKRGRPKKNQQRAEELPVASTSSFGFGQEQEQEVQEEEEPSLHGVYGVSSGILLQGEWPVEGSPSAAGSGAFGGSESLFAAALPAWAGADVPISSFRADAGRTQTMPSAFMMDPAGPATTTAEAAASDDEDELTSLGSMEE